jgi:DNA-binding NarL/FixJ family response regulator
MTGIRVVIVDDHVFYREGVRAMLTEHDSGLEIVGEAADGDAALALVARVTPDVVLMDLAMPGLDGIETTRALHQRYPDLAILVLTMSDDDSVFAALRAGARGYLLKQTDVDELGRAIRAVHRGEAIFGPRVAQRLSRYFARLPDDDGAERFPELTARERDVLRALARGADTAQIARHLELSQKTVYNYVATIITKLQVRDRAEAARRARDSGLV